MEVKNKNTVSRLSDGQPLLIDADELALLLGISKRSIWRRLSSGELVEPVRLGGSVRWRKQEVAAWVDAGCPRILPLTKNGM
jgi:excisionase family DNA binding protein